MKLEGDFFVITTNGTDTAGLGDDTFTNGNGFTAKTEVSGNIIIPRIIQGYRIISLLKYSIRNCTKIGQLTLPDSLISIEYGALTLSNIRKVVFPSSLVSIGDYNDCFHVAKVIVFQEGSRIETIGKYFIRVSKEVEEIVIPATVKSIGIGFANSCPKLKRVRFCGITDFSNIGEAFNDNSILKKVTVSYSYQGTLFFGKEIEKKEYSSCLSLPKCITYRRCNFRSIGLSIFCVQLISGS